MKNDFSLIRRTIAFLLLLFYPFNNSISDLILFHNYNPIVLIIVGIILLLPDMKTKIPKKIILFYAVEMILLSVLLINNELSGRYGYTIIQLLYLSIIPLLINLKIDKKAFYIVMGFYAAEHILGTIYPILLPELYKNSYLPLICASNPSHCGARIAFETGMNAGLTGQSTTNGCYMAIFALFYSSSFLTNKQKKDGILAIISLICLLTIGKRAHLLFTIISIIVIFLTKDKYCNIITICKNNYKLIALSTLLILGIIFLSFSVPQVNTTINRFTRPKENTDITSNRIPLYELALSEWHNRPLIGNGWGHYTTASHLKFGRTTYGIDYMHAHNDYLEILCDSGILGLIIYILLLGSLLGRLYKARNNSHLEKFSYAYIIFYILYGLTGTPLYIASNYVFILIAIIISRKINEKNRSNNIQ